MSIEIRQFLEYWVSLGGGVQPPARSLLDLRQLASILRWMFILEMDGSGTLKFRLAGSCIEEALGCGMTDRPYSSMLSANKSGAISEELYALSLVQGCGLLRSGTFTLDKKSNMELQVLALPFADDRTMGGIVMVGVVKPFEFSNQGFVDRRTDFDQFIDEILSVPSPRIVSNEQLTPRLVTAFDERKLELRVLDVERLLRSDYSGMSGSQDRFPSFKNNKETRSFLAH